MNGDSELAEWIEGYTDAMEHGFRRGDPGWQDEPTTKGRAADALITTLRVLADHIRKGEHRVR